MFSRFPPGGWTEHAELIQPLAGHHLIRRGDARVVHGARSDRPHFRCWHRRGCGTSGGWAAPRRSASASGRCTSSAMLAFSLPIPLGYDFATTAASLGLAIGASLSGPVRHDACAAHRRPPAGRRRGDGLRHCRHALHRHGGDADGAGHPLSAGVFAASLAIAIGASTAALWIARALSNDDARHVVRKRLGAALVMGVAITGMHYAGMAAAEFPPGAVCGAANGVNATWLATSVILLTFAILIVTLMLSRFDARTAFLAGAVSKLNGQIVRLATLDTLTGPAEPQHADRPHRTRDPQRAPATHAVRHPLHGPRRLQDHQRFARPLGRRRGPDSVRAAPAAVRARERHGRAAGRRRIRGAVRKPRLARRRRRARRRRARAHAPRRVDRLRSRCR